MGAALVCEVLGHLAEGYIIVGCFLSNEDGLVVISAHDIQ